MKAEYQGNEGFLQRDSVEHKGYAEARSTGLREEKERDGASDLLEAILDRDNLNRAYKRVKRNHGAAGIDGMTVEEALPWLKEHREELLRSIRNGSYMPSPVRRKEIPKPDGGVRKLGIPTVVDRVIQQAIAQKLQSIWEPLFSDSSYGYRPKRSARQAIQKVKEYAEEGYRYAVSVDLSKYFDTLNHELLMTLLHRQIQDMRVLHLIKKYLKSGVMENGVVCKTEEGSPQGGPLSPLLANIYLNEFDWEMYRRGVKPVRYADDIEEQFNPDRPNAVWCSDITYIWTIDGFVYLTSIMDLFSRKIIAWTLSKTLEVSCVIDSINKAKVRRNIDQPLIIHSDRGSQYVAREYIKATENMQRSRILFE